MFRMEFHAAEGGADAEAFASELSASVSKFTGLPLAHEGRLVTLTVPGRL